MKKEVVVKVLRKSAGPGGTKSPSSGVRILSEVHPVVKLARALGTPHGRKKHGLVMVEGFRAAEAALATGVRVKAALVASGAARTGREGAFAHGLVSAGVAVYELPRALYRMVSQVESPQGFALLCVSPQVGLAEALRGDLVLVVDRIQDPGNLGSILRSARAFGVNAVVTTAGTVEAANPKAVRAAAGAWPGLPIAEGIPPPQLSAALAERGFRVLIADSRAKTDYRDSVWSGRSALVMGSEAHGVCHELAGPGALAVGIAMHEDVESLNVAAAAAILLARARHERGAATGGGREPLAGGGGERLRKRTHFQR